MTELADYRPAVRQQAAARWVEHARAELDHWTRQWEQRDAADRDECYYLSNRRAGAQVDLDTALRYIKRGCRRIPATA